MPFLKDLKPSTMYKNLIKTKILRKTNRQDGVQSKISKRLASSLKISLIATKLKCSSCKSKQRYWKTRGKTSSSLTIL